MDTKQLEHLCRLSMLDYSDEWLETTAAEMTDIVALMDTIRGSGDDAEASTQRGVTLSQLREDIPTAPFSAESLLDNARTCDDCFVVPRIIG